MARQEQVIKIKIESGQAEQSINKLDKGLEKTSKTAKKSGKGLKSMFSGLGQAVSSAIPALGAFRTALISTGVGAIVVAIGSFIGVMAKAASKGAEFQKALSGLKAVSGSTAEEMNQLSTQAKELGSSTAFTASQVVELQTELAKLGFSVSDIQNSTPAILDLAASLDVSLAEAAATAGSTVRAFGLTTEDTQRVVDVMAASASASALDFESLRESLKLAAPTSRALGVSVEKTTALLGALADTGLKGSIAGTGLSKTFIELNKKGITLEDAMDKVRNSTNGLNTAIDLVGVVGSKSLLNLANSGEHIADLEDQFNNAEGAANRLAETRLDNLEGDMTKLGSAWEGFLLGVEDGEGPINKLQRIIVQGLTKAITGLGTVVDFVAFAFVDRWNTAKLQFGGTVDIFKGLFNVFGAKIKEFANNALLAIADIPIIGQAIDKEAAQRRINEANDLLLKGQQQLQDGTAKLQQASLNNRTFFARFQAQQEGKAERVEKQRQAKINQEQQAKLDDEQKKKDEEAAKKRADQIKKDREKLQKLKEKFEKADQDFEDKTNLEKAQRQRERALAELEELKLSETEKREAKKQINDYYDKIEAEAKEKDKEQRLAEEEAEKEKKKKQAEEDRKLEEEKIQMKYDTLDKLTAIAGAETGIGKALLIAKQILQAKESIMDLKNITLKGKKAIAKAGVNAAENVSESSKIGFPQNLVTIAAAIGQGVSIISSVKNAVKKTGAASSGASAPQISAGGGASQQPNFNIVGATGTSQLAEAIGGQTQQPIQTYVVANDVTTAQSLQNNIVEGATLS